MNMKANKSEQKQTKQTHFTEVGAVAEDVQQSTGAQERHFGV